MLAVVVALALCGALLTAGSAVAADFTWSGTASEPNWSIGANWMGGTAPNGTVGTLTFPELSEECTKLVATCYQSYNDIPGLEVNQLAFDTKLLSSRYTVSGEALTLGSGGLNAVNPVNFDDYGYASIKLPLSLEESQSWALSQQEVALEAPVTGTSAALDVQLGGHSDLSLNSPVEAGPVTITGSEPTPGGGAYSNGEVQLGNGALNASSGNPVQIVDAVLSVSPLYYRRVTTASTGALTSTGSEISLAEPLAVTGAVTLDEASRVTVSVPAHSPNGELTATGKVNLGNAALFLYDYSCGGAWAPGEVRTLITTTGSLIGRFNSIPNGSVVPVSSGGDSCPQDPPVRISYTAHSVTATVLDVEPYGGALTYRELASGGHNPSEFCLLCFMGKLISFFSPVDAPTGNFWHTFNDISVPSRGIPLDLTRTYNSDTAAADGPFGFGWSFPYDMSLGFPDATHVVVNQENGSQVTFTEESGGTYAAPPRVTATLVHNGDGSWTFVRRHRDTFSFDSGGRLTQEKDLNGYVTALAYNGSGQLATVTDPAGRKLTFAYTGNHITSVTDPMGRVVTYAYDGAGNLTDVADVNGGNTHFTYDTEHRMLTMRFPNQAPGVPGSTGAAVTNKYDAQGRVIEQTDQLGRTTKFAYGGEPLGEAGGTTTITDPRGNVIVQNYQFGELLSETKGYGTPQAATWTFGYDPATLGMTSVTDPNGHTTTSTFDSEGNTLTTTDALGRTTTNTYDSLNDLLTTTDPLDVTTTMTYDAHGNLLSRSRPLSGTSEVQTTTYTYGDVSHPGDITAMTDAEGNTWKYGYDAYGDRVSTTDPLGNEATSTYNAIGWLLSTTSPRGNVEGANPTSFTTTYAHNNFGQVTETVDPLGHKTISQYAPDENVIASTDANGNRTTYSYDAADEQTAVHRADGTMLQTTYWPDGTVKEQIDGAGHVTLYEYDPLGRVSAVTDPLGNTTRYGYDAAGNRTTVTDPEGRVTTNTYDAANELTAVTYSDGKTPNVTGITYDGDGERTGMTDGTGTWSWTWDSLHRLTQVVEGNNGTVKYQYNLRDDLTAITYPSGKRVSRGYDAAGRWTSVTDWLGNTTDFAYDPNGNLTTETLPSEAGIKDNFAYANDDSLSAINDMRGATTVFGASYTRDANRQLTSDTSQSAGEGSYGYNALNQLCYAGGSAASCASPPSGTTQYRYDSADNLTNMGATTQTFNAGDELTSVSTPIPSHENPEGGASQEATQPKGGSAAPGGVKVAPGAKEGQLTPTVTSGTVRFTSTGRHSKGTLSQAISTKTGGDLVLAFLSEKGSHAQHTSLKGAGLKWTVVTTASGSGGYLAIWQARAPKSLKHERITVRLARDASAALSTVAFDASAAVVKTAKAARSTRTPSLAVVVPSNTAVWMVGQQAGHRGRPKPSKGQALLASVTAPSGDTSWLQSDIPGAAGRVTIADSTAKRAAWMLAAVTIQERASGAKAARVASFSYGGLATAPLAAAASLASPYDAAATAPLADPAATETSTFTYDAGGDRTGFTASNGASQTYSYNQALELTGIGSEVSYAYNGDGLRMSKTVGGTATPFTWDVAGGLPSVLEDGTNVYVYGPGELPLEQITSSTPLWFHHDQLGSTRLLTDSTGNTVATYTYTAYGSLSRSSGVPTPLLFSGQYRDAGSGLYYLRTRYYDVATGQFVTRDPRVATTLTPYGYASADPLNRVDPGGTQDQTVDCYTVSPGGQAAAGYGYDTVETVTGPSDLPPWRICSSAIENGSFVGRVTAVPHGVQPPQADRSGESQGGQNNSWNGQGGGQSAGASYSNGGYTGPDDPALDAKATALCRSIFLTAVLNFFDLPAGVEVGIDALDWGHTYSEVH
jgi:RHS repeat-associated protein